MAGWSNWISIDLWLLYNLAAEPVFDFTANIPVFCCKEQVFYFSLDRLALPWSNCCQGWGMLFGAAVLIIKLTAFHGVWIGAITTVRGKSLKMLIDTGSNITMVARPLGTPRLCVPVDRTEVCSADVWNIAEFPHQKVVTANGFDGVLGMDFWKNFRTVTIDWKHKQLIAEP